MSIRNRLPEISITLAIIIMVWMIVQVLSQPLQAAEKEDLPLSSGYIPVEPLRRSQAPRKPVSVSSGYILSLETGETELVEIRTYQTGNRTVTTGQIGLRQIYVDTDLKTELKTKEK